jgi:sodium transport system permease protein
MNWRDISVVYFKELKDTLRDRRAIISMIVVPMLIIPVMMFGFSAVMIKMVTKAKAETPTVMIIGGEDSPLVVERLRSNPRIQIVEYSDDYAARISDKKLRAAVRIPDGFDAAVGTSDTPEVKIYHYGGEIKSGFAVQAVDEFFRELRDEHVRDAVAARGLPENFVRPFEFRRENVAPPEKVGGNMIGGFIPYIFIILCLTGAMYPAIDLTAGEKERGTMETILCSPVGRLDLVLGKFFLVMTASLGTIGCTLLSMAISFMIGGPIIGRMMGPQAVKASGAASAGGLPFAIDPMGVMAVFALLLPVAVFFAGLLLAVSLFAKSYKEAQTYVSPMVFFAIVPAMAAFVPGVDMNPVLALVPVLNISLVSKEILSGVYDWAHIAIVFGSMNVYAAASIAFCVAMFRRESVLFRG